MSALSTAASVLAFLEGLGAEASVVTGFIQSTVSAVESSGKTGADKLTAVLNATETFVNTLAPNLIADIQAFMMAVSAFVNETVAIYNSVGVFIHGIAAAL